MGDTATKSRDRPAKDPGGCECMDCGAIFVGAEWHTECGICAAWSGDGPTPFDTDDKFRAWLQEPEEKVIQGEYGYEPGEFTVYAQAWHPHYLEGLTPAQSFRRALDAFADDRAERKRRRFFYG